jgi:phosphocarrier protein
MKEFTYTLKDEMGLHARPAGLLAKKAASYKSSVSIGCGAKSGDAKKIISVMRLCAKWNDVLHFRVEGEDEEQAAQGLLSFLSENV